jgi:MOSC domain-containing protein YiiM
MSWRVAALMGGQGISFRGEEQSAIAKQPLEGQVAVHTLGLDGDTQVDKVHHGGPDMAVHHYPFDHHSFWREEIGEHELLGRRGAFGSNLSATGLTEDEVLLGDRFRLGSALLEACQPRQPCWKIEHRFGRKGMVAKILATGRSGWFYRVIETGEAESGDMLERTRRGDPEWSMRRMFETLWGTSTPVDKAQMARLAGHDLLPAKLREKTLKRIG